MSPYEGIVPAADIPATVTTIRLAGLVRDDSARILANWSMRIATLPVFRALPELALDELQEDMPALLDAVLEAVSISPYELDLAPMEEAEAKAETVDQPVAMHRADTLVHPPSTEPKTEIDEEGHLREQPTRASGEE